jgi:hypothetical protein
MKSSQFKYGVSYKRTPDWWSDDWADISDWCNSTHGAGNWEYINQHFLFQKQSDLTVFVLKWL